MRITNNMMISNMMQNLNKTMLRMNQRQMQAATGKRIHASSDDPLGMTRAMKIRTDIKELEQYKSNSLEALSRLETTETAIKDSINALQRIRELAVQASNGILTTEDGIKIKKEIDQLKDQLISIGNTSYSGNYIFSGKKTDQRLLDHRGNYIMPISYFRSIGVVDDFAHFQVGKLEHISVNTLGIDLFESFGDMSRFSHEINFPTGLGLDSQRNLDFMGSKITIEKQIHQQEIKFPDEIGEENEENFEFMGSNINIAKQADGSFEMTMQMTIDGEDRAVSQNYESEEELLEGIFDKYKGMLNEHNGGKLLSPENTNLTTADFESGFTFEELKREQDLGTKKWQIRAESRMVSQVKIPNVQFDADEEDSQEFFVSEIIRGEAVDIARGTMQQYRSLIGEHVIKDPEIRNLFNEHLNKQIHSTREKVDIRNFRFESISLNQGKWGLSASPERAGLFVMLDRISDKLEKGTDHIGDPLTISNELDEIDKFLDKATAIRADVGSKMNRLQLINNRIEDDTLNFTTLLADIEDADMGEILMRFMMEENVYKAALSVSARVIQPTLLDFLR